MQKKVLNKKRIKFDGREVSTRTLTLYDQHIQTFNKAETVTKDLCVEWNVKLTKAYRKDYKD